MILSKNNKHSQSPLLQIKQETLFADGSEYFNAMLRDIAEARHTILIETFIFSIDLLGNRIIEALIEASYRGVTIKILVDGAGSSSFITQAAYLNQCGIQTKIYHPFPWHIWSWSRSAIKLPIALKTIYLILNMQRRNHRKTCLIDNSIAYIGSFNISQKHLSLTDHGSNWRDTGIRLEAPSFAELTESFELCWYQRSIQEVLRDAFRRVGKNPILRLNNTRHRRRILYKQLLRRIKTAKSCVWITNSYFVPDNRLLKSLILAASHHSDVRILVPRKGDTLLPMPWASACFYESLLKAGVRIYEYLPTVLHAKTIIVDDWVLIGSSNLDYLSLIHNLEIDVRLTKPETINATKIMFLDDLTRAQEISINTLNKHRPLYQRILGRLMLFARYWI